MLLRSILYVSKSNLVIPGEEARVQEIVARSIDWNRSVGITGALMFTEVHFAQYIEGPREAIDDLVTKLRADDRHRSIDVIRGEYIKERRFTDWNLAFSGPEFFLEDDLVRILGFPLEQPRDRVAKELIDLMLLLAEDRSPAIDMPDVGARDARPRDRLVR